jgi:hypothetical protein
LTKEEEEEGGAPLEEEQLLLSGSARSETSPARLFFTFWHAEDEEEGEEEQDDAEVEGGEVTWWTIPQSTIRLEAARSVAVRFIKAKTKRKPASARIKNVVGVKKSKSRDKDENLTPTSPITILIE